METLHWQSGNVINDVLGKFHIMKNIRNGLFKMAILYNKISQYSSLYFPLISTVAVLFAYYSVYPVQYYTV